LENYDHKNVTIRENFQSEILDMQRREKEKCHAQLEKMKKSFDAQLEELQVLLLLLLLLLL